MATHSRRRARGVAGRVMWESTDLTYDKCKCGARKRKTSSLCIMCRLDAQDAYDDARRKKGE